MAWIANMEIGFDPNNNVVKRLWYKYFMQSPVISAKYPPLFNNIK